MSIKRSMACVNKSRYGLRGEPHPPRLRFRSLAPSHLPASQTRWTEAAEGLARAYVNLTGDMMISAGIIAYAGAFTASYRSRIIQSFVDMCREDAIPHTPKFSLSAILGEPVKVRASQGLPGNDSVDGYR